MKIIETPIFESDEARVIVICVLALLIAITLWITNDNSTSVELAKAGLQECRIGSSTTWQKECQLYRSVQ